MAFLDFLLGKKEKTQEYQNFSPQQNQLLDLLQGGAQQQFPQALQFLGSILGQNPEALQAFQAPAMRQFQEEIIPTLAERFTTLGAQGSSAFNQRLGQAGAGLAENLAAQRAGLSFNALQQLQSLLPGILAPRTTTVVKGAQPGALPGLLSLAGKLGGAYLGGPAAGIAGGEIGSELGGLFSR
jgi:hypothetical protein